MLSVTLGCTRHGFSTCETPCTRLPIPADYPDPCRGCGFLEGMGIGHREVTRGLPMPITNQPPRPSQTHMSLSWEDWPIPYSPMVTNQTQFHWTYTNQRMQTRNTKFCSLKDQDYMSEKQTTNFWNLKKQTLQSFVVLKVKDTTNQHVRKVDYKPL